jgi:sterol desaturase/sphingolipid hydroxylase (fatty acid hydroxylase superfamily)
MTQANATPPEGFMVAMPAPAARRFVRAAHIEAGYSPWRHMALTLVLATALATVGLALAARARAADWLLLPAFLVLANFLEWMVHRHPMHRPLRPRIMYRNHSQLHHLAFTDANMVIGPSEDLGLIMMPWYTMLGLFALASPVMVAAGLLRGPGLAGVFLLGAVAYFLCYELLHALYHLPDAVLDRAGIGRVRAFRRLQAHHRHHHILGRMAAVNFNVTFPLMDRLFGTLEK